MTRRIWRSLGLRRSSCRSTRWAPPTSARVPEQLVSYLREHEGLLDDDSRRRSPPPVAGARLQEPALAGIIAAAPSLLDFLGAESRAHFDAVCAGLRAAGVAFVVNPARAGPRLLRAHRVRVGHDRARRAGYGVRRRPLRRLVEQLGGRPTRPWDSRSGSSASRRCWRRRRRGRARRATRLSGRVRRGGGGRGPAARRADARPLALAAAGHALWRRRTQGAVQACRPQRAAVALVLGESEVARGVVGLKPLRVEGEQEEIRSDELAGVLAARLRRLTTATRIRHGRALERRGAGRGPQEVVERERQVRVGGVVLGWPWSAAGAVAVLRAEPADTASARYDEMIVAAENRHLDRAVQVAEGLRVDFDDTAYASSAPCARPTEARGRDRGRPGPSRWVRANAPDPGLRQIATLRMARILIDDGELDAAQRSWTPRPATPLPRARGTARRRRAGSRRRAGAGRRTRRHSPASPVAACCCG